MKQWALVVALVACGKGEKTEKAETKQSADSPKPAESKKDVEPPKVEMKGSGRDLCKKIDTDAIAKALELPGGLSRTGGGVLVKGGKEPASLSCSYYQKDMQDGGMSFGFIVKDAKDYERRDTLGRFKWEDYADFGQPAKIGRAKDGGVHVQTVANGGLVIVNAQKDGTAAADLEKKLVAAAKLLLAQLPADAAAEIR